MPVRVKVCGITSVEAAAQAADAGADAIGLVFYPPSSRYVDDWVLARDIALAAGPLTQVVGLFVNADTRFIETALREVPINTLQFHGDEAPEFCRQFSRPFIKALRMKAGLDVEIEAGRYADARGILLDSYKAGVPGGTGESFDWSRIPSDLPHVLLAGGLNPANVAEAVRQVRPYAVDVSGGVESAPGIKQPEKVAAFIRRAKAE